MEDCSIGLRVVYLIQLIRALNLSKRNHQKYDGKYEENQKKMCC